MKAFALILLATSLHAAEMTFQQKLEYGFTTFDADKDSALSADEFSKLGEFSPKLKGKPQVVDYLFQTLDANSDKKLSRAEYMNIAGVGSTTPHPPSNDGVAFFEKNIRPVLVEKCYKCHSATSEKVKGGLVLDTREGIRKGGDTGPGVVPGDVKSSLVLEAMRFTNKELQMPSDEHGGKLPDSVISDIEQWIKMGAPDPRDGKAAVVKSEWDTEEARSHWAYQPIKKAVTPAVKNSAWPKKEMDRFVLAGLEAKGITPVGDAVPETLVRRLYFDLIGLPPTPGQVDEFVKERDLGKVVDELLKSPHFGERWGRHWLDVARFAESTGKDVNCLLPHAWRYRDYVIESFNKDKPIDQFFHEQLAGDLLEARDSRDRALKQIATGFLAVGPRSLNERDRRQYALDMADEQIDAISQSMLGITVACARCHDHKFDPISQRDYYALAGIFLSTETCYGTAPTFQNTHHAPMIELSSDCGLPRLNTRLTEEQRASREKELKSTERYGTLQFYGTALKAKLTGSGFNVNNDPKKLVMFVGINAKIGEIKTELASYEADGRPKLLAMGVRDYPTTPKTPITKPKSVEETFEMLGGRSESFTAIADSPLFIRGDSGKPGDKVPRGFISSIGAAPLKMPSNESGRRELAAWITSESNPLTARVFANRVWHWLFGRGIVPSVDNFGVMGQSPSNPALLDHLALQLTAGGWSLKSLIKEIVTSRTYQLAATYDQKNFDTDPENALLWRMSPRRLDAECIRDGLIKNCTINNGIRA